MFVILECMYVFFAINKIFNFPPKTQFLNPLYLGIFLACVVWTFDTFANNLGILTISWYILKALVVGFLSPLLQLYFNKETSNFALHIDYLYVCWIPSLEWSIS